MENFFYESYSSETTKKGGGGVPALIYLYYLVCNLLYFAEIRQIIKRIVFKIKIKKGDRKVKQKKIFSLQIIGTDENQRKRDITRL